MARVLDHFPSKEQSDDEAVHVLRRRMRYLLARLIEAEERGQDLTYDRAEYAALRRAVECLEAVIESAA